MKFATLLFGFANVICAIGTPILQPMKLIETSANTSLAVRFIPVAPPDVALECGQIYTGSTAGATNVVGNRAGDSLYSLHLNYAQDIVLDSCGSDYDTYLRVFSSSGAQVCFCDDCGPCGYLTVLECSLDAGDYVVVMDGWSDREGPYSLSLTCDDALESLECGQSYTGTTAGATNVVGNTAGDSLYTLHLDSAQAIVLDSCGSGYDTWIRVLDSSGAEQCGCDDCGPCGLQTVLECSLDAGDYVVVMDGWSTREGAYSLSVTCDAIYEALACGQSYTGTTVGATNDVGNTAGDSLYSLHLDSAQDIVLNSCESGYDTWIRVLDSSGVQVCDCDDCGDCGLQTVLECSLVAGDYVVVMDGYSNREGLYSFSLTCDEVLECGQSYTGTTLGATNDVGNAAGDRLYPLHLDSAQDIVLNSCGSGYDTYIRVFDSSGDQVCACDDCGSCGLQTVLQCPLAAGSYVVAMDGYSNREGDYRLSVVCS